MALGAPERPFWTVWLAIVLLVPALASAAAGTSVPSGSPVGDVFDLVFGTYDEARRTAEDVERDTVGDEMCHQRGRDRQGECSRHVERWSARYDGPAESRDDAEAMVQSPDGSTLYAAGDGIVGTVPCGEETCNHYEAFVLAYDASDGTLLWKHPIPDPSGNGSSSALTSVEISPDGERLYAVGSTWRDTHWAVAIDAQDGERVWTQTGIPGHRATSLSPDGSTLYTEEGAIETSSGATRFTFETCAALETWDLSVVATDESVYIDGEIHGETFDDRDLGLVALDASDGTCQWTSTYDGGLADTQSSRAEQTLTVSPDGSTVLLGGSSDGGPSTGDDIAVAAFDAETGELAWSTRFNGPEDGRDAFMGLTVGPAGTHVYITGTVNEEQGCCVGGHALVALALDAATGQQRWVTYYASDQVAHTLTGLMVRGHDHGRQVAVSPDGGQLFVTGLGVDERYRDDRQARWTIATLALSPDDGELAWSAHYTEPASADRLESEVAQTLVSPDGQAVYVLGATGADHHGPAKDLALVAYDAEPGFDRVISDP